MDVSGILMSEYSLSINVTYLVDEWMLFLLYKINHWYK